MNLTQIAEALQAKESVDKSDFQRRARIFQSISAIHGLYGQAQVPSMAFFVFLLLY